MRRAVISTILILVFLLLLVLINVWGARKSGSPAEQEAKVAAALGEYQKNNLMEDNILDPTDFELSLGGSFIFEAGNPESFFSGASALDDSELKHYTSNEFIAHILNILTKDTKFDGKVQVNQLPTPDAINLYFLKEDPEDLVDHFKDNCVYMGYLNVIICDANFVRSQLDEVAGYDRFYSLILINAETGEILNNNPDNLKTIRSLMKSSFLVWFIGHEIGHAIKHHDYVVDTQRYVHFNEVDYSERELEADAHVAEMLSKSLETAAIFDPALGEFIEHEFRELYLKSGRPAPSNVGMNDDTFAEKTQLVLRYSKYNMPLLVRALRISDLLQQQVPNLNETGHIQKIRKNVVLQEGFLSVEMDTLVMFLTWSTVMSLGVGAILRRRFKK